MNKKFFAKKQTNKQRKNTENTFKAQVLIEQQDRPAIGNICTLSMFSHEFASSLDVPLKVFASFVGVNLQLVFSDLVYTGARIL